MITPEPVKQCENKLFDLALATDIKKKNSPNQAPNLYLNINPMNPNTSESIYHPSPAEDSSYFQSFSSTGR